MLSPDSTLMFLHSCGELTASLAHIGAGTLGARDSIQDIPPSLRGKGVLHVHLATSCDTPWTKGRGRHVGWGVPAVVFSAVGSSRRRRVR